MDIPIEAPPVAPPAGNLSVKVDALLEKPSSPELEKLGGRLVHQEMIDALFERLHPQNALMVAICLGDKLNPVDLAVVTRDPDIAGKMEYFRENPDLKDRLLKEASGLDKAYAPGTFDFLPEEERTQQMRQAMRDNPAKGLTDFYTELLLKVVYGMSLLFPEAAMVAEGFNR